MKTVGSILREARVAKKIILADVEQGTKIRIKFLEAIESDDFSVMPSISYAKGFVKNYSDFLGLDSGRILAFFRRQNDEMPGSALLPKSTDEPLNRTFWQLTPGRFIALLVACLASLFLIYLGYQYRALRQAPMLIIDAPANQVVVSDRRIDILGKTDPDATITINGISVLVRGDGKFFDQIALESGVNTITVVATSRLGKTTSQIREVGVKD
jgi:cytoskeletal protein RodZ